MAYTDPATKVDMLSVASALLAVHRALGTLRDLPPDASSEQRAASWNATTAEMNIVLEKCQDLLSRIDPVPPPQTNALLGHILRPYGGKP